MDFKEPRAIYLQIADRIADDILQQRYAADERIPSVREYASLVEVNANTAMRSYDYLQEHNIIYNKRGVGYFVSAAAKDTILSLRREMFLNCDLPECFRQARLLTVSPDELTKRYTQYLQQK